MKVSYGGHRDPSFRCDHDSCGSQWYVPQSVRWDSAVMTESAQTARDAGWLIEEYRTRCPQHTPGAEMRLTDAECDNAIKALAIYEWTGLTRDDVRLIFGTIWNARGVR